MKAYYLCAAIQDAEGNYLPAIADIVDSRQGKWALCFARRNPPTHMIIAVSDRLAAGRSRDATIHTLCKAAAVWLGDDLQSVLNRLADRAESRGALLVDQTVGDE